MNAMPGDTAEMVTDYRPLLTPSPATIRAAQVQIAAHARDVHEARDLLDMLIDPSWPTEGTP